MHYFLMGLAIGLSLIISLGPQNLFLIQQGVKKEYHWFVASLCLFCDILLITGSVMGLNHLVSRFSWLKTILLIAGVAFLVYYGLYSLRQAFKPKSVSSKPAKANKRLKIILVTLSFSLLNPQAIIDTVIMIGGSASQLEFGAQYPFMMGVIASSCLWFYSLTFTASRFSRILAQQKVFQGLQFCSGLLMLACSFKLLLA